jgi:hypothetical protein
MDFDLTRLRPPGFEPLVADLFFEVFADRKPSFANGPYGGREATVTRTLVWPGGETWSNQTAVNVLYTNRFLDQPEQGIQWLLSALETMFRNRAAAWNQNLLTLKENERLIKENRRRAAAGRPERRLSATRVFPANMLIITNLRSRTPADPHGQTRVNNFIAEHAQDIGLSGGWAIWDLDQLSQMLTEKREIRERYAAYLIPGDALSFLREYVSGLHKSLGETISRQVPMELMADRWIRLSQAGDPTHEKLSLSHVAIDLPLREPHAQAGAAQFILRRGDQPLRTSDMHSAKPHVVLVGGPGQGKTTIGQLVCQVYRAALLSKAPWLDYETSRLLVSLQEGLVRIGLPIPAYYRWPIRVELSAYSDAASGPSQTALLRYITDQINSRTSASIDVPKMRNWLRKWPWLVVLDGLDEVASRHARDTLMGRISDFMTEAARANADLFIVATTRPQGYTGEFSADQYMHIELDSLMANQAIAYAKRLAEVRHANDLDMRLKLSDRIEDAAAQDSTARLMRSPLQVTIMSLLLEGRERAPQARYSLFDAYYETIYAREAAKPGAIGMLLEERRGDINALHDRIGLLLQIHAEKLGGADASLPRNQLRDLAIARLTAEGYEPADSRKLADEIIRAVTQRLVLIVPKAIEDVGFEVRSIQEFMASRAIVTGPDEIVTSRLREVVPSAHWRNTWLFAAGRIFAQREHLRAALVGLLPQIDASDLVCMVVAPGSDLALDLLDDDVASTAPNLRRVLARHALTLLQYAPDPDLKRHSLVLFRCSSEDRLIGAAAEQAIAQALQANPAQAIAAETICRVWKDQVGALAAHCRQLIGRLESAQRRGELSRSQAPGLTMAGLLRSAVDTAEVTTEERKMVEALMPLLESMRVLPEGVTIDRATVLATDDRGLFQECLSHASIADIFANAAIHAASETWVGASELRNLLRAWLQRRSAGEKILAMTPFPEVPNLSRHDSDVQGWGRNEGA